VGCTNGFALVTTKIMVGSQKYIFATLEILEISKIKDLPLLVLNIALLFKIQ